MVASAHLYQASGVPLYSPQGALGPRRRQLPHLLTKSQRRVGKMVNGMAQGAHMAMGTVTQMGAGGARLGKSVLGSVKRRITNKPELDSK